MRHLTTDVLVVGAGRGPRHRDLRAAPRRACSSSSAGPTRRACRGRPPSAPAPWRSSGPGLDAAIRAGAVDADPRVAVGATLVDAARSVPFSYPGVREALAVSPTYPAICPQDHVEPVLVAEVRRLGGEIRFGTALRQLRVVRGGVQAGIDGVRVRARFVVGADGSRSTVRTALGIPVTHLGSLGRYVQALFRADIAARLGRRPAGIAFANHPDAAGVLLPVGFGRWAYAHACDPARGELPADYTPDRWCRLIRTATGMPDLGIELIGALPFEMAADVAERFRAGPGFLVGRRRTPDDPGRRHRHEHRHPRRPRAGLEAGLGRARPRRRGAAGQPRGRTGPAGRGNAARSLLRDEPHLGDGLPTDLGRTYRSVVIDADEVAPEFRLDRAARPGERAPHA